MAIDRARLTEIFTAIGAKLTKPATLCLFGSAPAILHGQPGRQTQDIDIWRPASEFERADLETACMELGILYDPKQEVAAGDIYVQIVTPGIVSFPAPMRVETVERFGNLTVVMPDPALIAAAKLVRFNARDIDDIIWWTSHRAIEPAEMEAAIRELPSPLDREDARGNMVIVRILARSRT